jgi:hypothetical protein
MAWCLVKQGTTLRTTLRTVLPFDAVSPDIIIIIIIIFSYAQSVIQNPSLLDNHWLITSYR